MSQEEQPQYPTVTGELSFILFSLTPTVSHPLTWLDLLDNLITSARDVLRPLQTATSLGWTISPCSCTKQLLRPWAPWWLSLNILWLVSLSWIRGPKLQCNICGLSAEERGMIPFLGLLALLLLIQPRVLLALVAGRAHCWHWPHWLPLNLSVPSLSHCKRLFPPVGRALVLVGFHQAPVSSSIPTVWNLLVITQPWAVSTGPISLASPDNWLRADSISSFRAPAQKLNRTSPRRDHGLLTGLQAECDPLTTTLWVQPHKHLSVPIPLPTSKSSLISIFPEQEGTLLLRHLITLN